MKIYFINGFLGSGKTSLIKKLLQDYSTGKLAVIINEYGDTDFDVLMLVNNKTPIRLIKEGLLFCVCKLTEFTTVLQELVSQDYETIVVETSGFSNLKALNATMSRILASSDKELEYYNITIVDGTNFPKLHNLPLISSQLEVADFVLLNKIDLLSKQDIEKTQALIRQYSQAPLLLCSYCEVEALLDKIEAANKRKTFSLIKDRDENLCSYKMSIDKAIGSIELRELLERLKERVLRAKGIVDLKEGRINCQLASGLISLTASDKEVTGLMLFYTQNSINEAEIESIMQEIREKKNGSFD